MNTKPLIQSKTVAGATAMLIAYFTALLAGEQSAYTLVDAIASMGVVAGFGATIYGRIVAKQPIGGVVKSAIADFQATPIAQDDSHE